MVWTQADALTVPTCYILLSTPFVVHLNPGRRARSLLLLADSLHTYFTWTGDDADDAIAVKDAFRCPQHSEQPTNGTYQVATHRTRQA
eukprot:scaffold29672_cov48-Phaeocystis_antarctica.AAC.2